MPNTTLDRKTPPPFIKSTTFELIAPTKINLPSGLQLQFVSGGFQDVVKIELIFRAGRWFEHKWGVSHFTSNLVSKGTKTKSSFHIAQMLDQYGAHLEVSPGTDFVSLSLYSIAKNLEPVLSIFHELVAEPVFPEKELEQSKSIYLQNLKVNQEKTSFLASKLFRKNIFGDKHPYGKELEERDVENVNQHDLVAFHAQLFKEFQVIISGKIDARIQNLVITTFSQFTNWSSIEKNHVSEKQVSSSTYIEKKGSLQTSIRLGKKSILKSHADYVDVLFLNHILGGYFGSRLMKNIREDKGLTYGIHASLHSLKHESYMVIGADVNKENREVAIVEIRNEIKKLRHHQVDKNELETAQYHFIGSLQSEITTPFAHADKLKNMLLHNLDEHYYTRLIDRIDTITAAELLATANTYFDEDSFAEVSVG